MRRRLGAVAATIALTLTLAAPAATVLAAAPANDDINDAIVVPGIPYTNSQSTIDATTGATDVDCAGGGHSVWYQFTPTEDGRLEADTFGSDFDTTLAVGTPDGLGGISLISCNDDALDLQSRVRWDAFAGTTYLFQVGSFADTAGGNLVFNLDVAPPPPELTVTLDNMGRVDREGVATISGAYTCQNADFVDIEALLRQQVGRFIVNGFGAAGFGCPDTGTRWQLQVFGDNGRFSGGKVLVSLSAIACSGKEECTFVDLQRTINLRR